MATRPSLRYTAPANATDPAPAALAERYPFLPPAGQWDVPDWLVRARCGFAPGPFVSLPADGQASPSVAPFMPLVPR